MDEPRDVVRRARPADAAAVWPLARDFATSFQPTRSVFEMAFPRLLARDDTLVLVAESSGGEVVGYLLGSVHLTFLADGPVAWIEEVMVREERRRRGIGEGLMRAAEEWAGERGAAYVSLASRRAGDFYRALGYVASATFYRRSPAG